MRVNWILSQETPKNLFDINVLKDIAPTWGSWQIWKNYKVDNCICTDLTEAHKLIKRAFHAVCNLYISQDDYVDVGRPSGVKLFSGQFVDPHIDNKDDIVALNLAAANSDILLMSGFNFDPISDDDPIEKHKREAYYYNVSKLIEENNDTQFVLVDYTNELMDWIRTKDNLTFDTLTTVQTLLS